ncbi:MAG TPA: mechanosensitive ion channel family protein [Firmicutes bacterium]|nr:mechanosensitive ion channel family protein [Candidatus Fermentithermobacillaceae bacterium]
MEIQSVLYGVNLVDTDFWLSTGAVVARIGAVIVMALLVVKIGNSLINKLLSEPKGKVPGLPIDEARAETLSGLLRSTLRYVTGIVALLMVLDLLGIDTKALLGGAAVLGLAVGFGAQNLVRDVITGFFLIYERQYDVGDYVTIAGVSGIVEQIGLRTTVLRDWSGDVHTVPNGLVEKTTNSSRRGSRALVEVPVSYAADLRQVIDIMEQVCEQAAEELPAIREGPRVLGVKQLGESGVVLLVWARAEPLSQWNVERELRLRIKEALDTAGIEVPYPRLVVCGESHKEGCR